MRYQRYICVALTEEEEEAEEGVIKDVCRTNRRVGVHEEYVALSEEGELVSQLVF